MPPQSSAPGQGDKRATRQYADSSVNSKSQIHRFESPTLSGHLEGPPPKKQRTRQSSIASSTTADVSLSSRPALKISLKSSTINGHAIITNTRTVYDSHRGSLMNGGVSERSPQTTKLRGLTEKDDNDKRTLRSQAGTSRLKSDLELFIPDYKDLVFGPEQEPVLPDAESVFYLVDSQATKALTTLAIRQRDAPRADHPKLKRKHRPSNATTAASLLTTATLTLDLSAFQDEALTFTEDPLADEVYMPSHSRGERKQKKERNVEKERSAHEKEQLQGLYDGLRGPDWLRIMGVSGVTDTEKKTYESKRDICLVKVKKMLAKFDNYKEQEKLLKIRRDKAAARAAAIEGDVEDEVDEEDDDTDCKPPLATLDEPALQLQQEASSATKLKLKLRFSPTGKEPEKPPEHPKPFTSFFSKPHERAGALGRHRRGRHAMAFGQPLADIPEQVEFGVPSKWTCKREAQRVEHVGNGVA